MACRRICRKLLEFSPSRRYRSTAVVNGCPHAFQLKMRPAQEETEEKGAPYECIPSPKGLPLVGTILDIIRGGGAAKIHEYCDQRHRELGPIFREKLGDVEAVVLANQDYFNKVYQSEGEHPLHLVPKPWLMYNEMRGIKRGLFFMDGAQWKKSRQILNKSLLDKHEVAKYSADCSEVVEDVLDRWGKLAVRNKNILPNLENELYNWSIESLGTIVFERRLQCVTSPNQESEMHEFVYYVQQIFGESAKLSIIPPKFAAAFRLPVWNRFVKAADNALRMARNYTEARIAEIEQGGDTGNHAVLGKLLSADVSQDDIVNIVADLILAAADTTSHATQWALYLLAKNPEYQEKLLNQIKEVVPSGEVKNEHLEKISYSNWIIRETLRLYPIASFLTRILPNNVVVGGYEIPAGKLMIMSQYTMGRNSKSFKEPEKFNPERWDRDKRKEDEGKEKKEVLNIAKGCMPFGSGARSCIGKKIAEMKMRLLLCKLVQRFRMESANDVGVALRMITTPDRPIQIRLQKRK